MWLMNTFLVSLLIGISECPPRRTLFALIILPMIILGIRVRLLRHGGERCRMSAARPLPNCEGGGDVYSPVFAGSAPGWPCIAGAGFSYEFKRLAEAAEDRKHHPRESG